jgi:hypothetical protein
MYNISQDEFDEQDDVEEGGKTTVTSHLNNNPNHTQGNGEHFCGWIMNHLNEHNKKMHQDNCKFNKNKRNYRNLGKECILMHVN